MSSSFTYLAVTGTLLIRRLFNIATNRQDIRHFYWFRHFWPAKSLVKIDLFQYILPCNSSVKAICTPWNSSGPSINDKAENHTQAYYMNLKNLDLHLWMHDMITDIIFIIQFLTIKSYMNLHQIENDLVNCHREGEVCACRGTWCQNYPGTCAHVLPLTGAISLKWLNHPIITLPNIQIYYDLTIDSAVCIFYF